MINSSDDFGSPDELIHPENNLSAEGAAAAVHPPDLTVLCSVLKYDQRLYKHGMSK